MKPILYISGPYSADSLIERQQNIWNAKRRFINVLATGEWWAVCPHTHTAELEMHLPDVDHSEWLCMDIAMLAGCDALWIDIYKGLPSPGVQMELAWAIEAGMPVYDSPYIAKPAFMVNDNTPHLKKMNMSRIELMYGMVLCGEIPDPKTYKGSVLR